MFTELGKKLGFHIVHQSPQKVEMTMPVKGNRQIVGLLHGGATAALIEEAGSRLALELAQPGMVPAGTELSLSHVATAQGDEVRATAELLHLGKKNCVVQVRVCDGSTTLAIGRITCVYITK
ncbi:PaaI family thioesterase [Arcanobacterium canis]